MSHHRNLFRISINQKIKHPYAKLNIHAVRFLRQCACNTGTVFLCLAFVRSEVVRKLFNLFAFRCNSCLRLIYTQLSSESIQSTVVVVVVECILLDSLKSKMNRSAFHSAPSTSQAVESMYSKIGE